ncbi:M48 family metalloprotease [Marinomonas sp.]|uniref:M48 family metalloprotease n=1 Tax=Marinomonas sp. TaxID=1904862 RepID=UPI003BAA77B2
MQLDKIDLNLLRYLDSLLREQNVTHAANQLGITQPAMSNGLRRLRDLFHDPLLVRTSDGMMPTALAIQLQPRVQSILQSVDEVLHLGQSFEAESSSRVFRIMASDYAEATLIPPLMKKLQAEAPNVILDVMNPSDVSFHDVEKGKVDLVINRFDVLPQSFHQKSVWVDDEQVNAFALPGYKVGVYTGLLKVADNQSQLAAVVGHELAHVIARHGNERVSTQLATSQALALGYQLSGEESPEKVAIFQALGLGAQIGIILPFSRTHESEADLLGQEYMAKAGFDPRESVQLWRNMSANGGSKTPELLSTHPANSTRIEGLQNAMPPNLATYETLVAQNRQAQCY